MTRPKVFDKQIASVGHIEQLPDGRDTYVIDRPGMTREEIVKRFAPKGRPSDHGYNRRGLIRAVIYEAYLEAQNGYDRDPMNIRGFWYDRLLGTIRRAAQDQGDQVTIDVTINEAWGDLIEGGWATYAGMNIYSAKSGNYHIGVQPNSPYPTSILLVEKEDHFEPLHGLADTYEISFVATGGQNSRCAAMEFADKLRKAGVDTTQGFTVYSFCDFDPEGWAIPEAFIEHLALKIEAPIELVRLGVLPEQITEAVLLHQGSPYSPETKTESAAKGVATKYQRFVDETGGCFIPDTGEPARIELNMYKTDQIRDKILAGLSKHIDGFEYQKPKLRAALAREHDSALRVYSNEFRGRVSDAYAPYFEAIDQAREWLDGERRKRAPEARRRKRELQSQIEALDREIRAATSDIRGRERQLIMLENHLTDMASGEDIRERLPWDFPGTYDLRAKIERNGGWRQWVADLGISTLEPEALAQAARAGSGFSWSPGPEESGAIRQWILEQFPAAPDPTGPAQSPEALIEQALGGDD